MKILLQYLKSRTIKYVGLPLALLSAANVYFEHNMSTEEYSLVGIIFAAAITWARSITVEAIKDK